MLILQRKAGQSLRIGENITVTIVAVENNRVRIAIDAPTDISILRSELIEAIAANQEAALQPETAASELLALIGGTGLIAGGCEAVAAALITTPSIAPRIRLHTTSRIGSSTTLITSTAPTTSALATPKDTANKTSPTASSSATMGSRISVSGPLALYCRTTISVAAGAVAEATAPSTTAAGSGSLSGIRKCRPMRAASTSSVVNTACTVPTTNA